MFIFVIIGVLFVKINRKIGKEKQKSAIQFIKSIHKIHSIIINIL
jgi:hypothetical protein